MPKLLLLAAAMLLAFTLEGYELYRLTLAAVYAVAIMGLALLIGLGGLFSVGHSAFFAIGAYAVAISMTRYGAPAIAGLLLAALGGLVAGYLVGWPARRLGFVHMALVTWGLALAVPQLLKSSHLAPWTQGVQGIYLDRPGPPEGIPLNEDQWWFMVSMLVLGLALVAGERISKGRGARALRALKDHRVAAAACGVNTQRYITTLFSISAMYAALAGGLAALLSDYVAPDAYGVFFSILLLVGAVAGGTGSVWGAIAGGLLVEYLPDMAADASAALSFPAFGLLLVILMYVLPGGLAGAVSRLAQAVRRRRGQAGHRP